MLHAVVAFALVAVQQLAQMELTGKPKPVILVIIMILVACW